MAVNVLFFKTYFEHYNLLKIATVMSSTFFYKFFLFRFFNEMFDFELDFTGFTGFYKIISGLTDVYRVLPSFTRLYWFFTGFDWV